MARRIEDPEVMGLPAGSLEDKDLTLAYQRGEDGAYQAIYDRYAGRVHSVCRRMLGNGQDAQDAAQESFLRIYQALGRFNGRYQLGAWITRIATNVCLDHIRAKSRRPKNVVPLDIAELDTPEDLEVEGPDEVVIRRSEGRKVRKVLESLPPMHRAAIVLRDFEGLSYEEVAIALEITECQVKALIHRARQGFKRSWTSIALGFLFPARVFQRVRKLDTPKPDPSHASSVQQLAESVTATAAPAATSCSAAFGQCGQFVADKFAPALTAVALGAASLAAPAIAQDRSLDVSAERVTAAEPPAAFGFSDGEGSVSAAAGSVKAATTTPREEESERTADRAAAATAEAVPSASTVVPAAPVAPEASPMPTPTPTPTPAPESSPTPPPQKTEKESDGQPPAPTGPPAVGVRLSSTTGSSRVPDSMNTSFRCTDFGLAQSLATSVSRGSSSWPMRLDVSGTHRAPSIQVVVMVSGREVLFTTAGLQTSFERSGDRASAAFTGTYQSRNQEARDTLGVPLSGNFQLRYTLDCASKSVIAESLNFEA